MSWIGKALKERASRAEILLLFLMVLVCYGWQAVMGEPMLTTILGVG